MTIYLYVKQHSVTGLKYFGKTEKSHPFVYNGSGDYWLNHIKIHGKEHVVTIGFWEFNDLDECSKFALEFSERHNIVHAVDSNGKKIWANMKPEDGKDGGQITEEIKSKIGLTLRSHGENHSSKRPEFKEKMRKLWSGDGNPSRMPGAKERLSKPKTESHKANLRKPRRNPRSESHKRNHAESLKRRNLEKGPTLSKKVTCPHCGKTGGSNVMYRFHFDNCKSNPNVERHGPRNALRPKNGV